MMDKKIRRLIDDIFSDMKMTADNLALRDEMMANAQARYEDSVHQGKTEEEAFAEVAASLGDVQSLLKEMNAQDGGKQDVPNASEEPKAEETEEPEYFKDRRLQVSIFMNIFNVHINWFPVNGVIKYFKYHKGNFAAAYLPKSSTENERTTMLSNVITVRPS